MNAADTEHAARVIVGAGLAGSAAAIALARAGAAPLLLERAAAHARPRICGEFVSAEAANSLSSLGVDVRALGGVPTRRLRVACGPLCIEAELPFEAIGLSRHTLDAALQAQAERQGAVLRRGSRITVCEPAAPDRPFELTTPGAATVVTPTLLLACGKSDLAPFARRPRHAPEALVGLQTHLVLAPGQARAIDGHVEVLLFGDSSAGAPAAARSARPTRSSPPPEPAGSARSGGSAGPAASSDGDAAHAAAGAGQAGYAGLQPVDGGRVNLCLLVDTTLARRGLPAALAVLRRQCPLLDERLTGAAWPAEPPQSIARVPYGYLHRPAASSPGDPPNLWRLGDQAAVIPSFTGDGMAIALHSATLATAVLLEGGDPLTYNRRLRDDIGAQMARAMALYRIGRSGPGRRALLGLLRRWPGLLGFIATMTRVPPSALR